MDNEAKQLVLHLHDIARRIESLIGSGELSHDLRCCADRINELLQETV